MNTGFQFIGTAKEREENMNDRPIAINIIFVRVINLGLTDSTPGRLDLDFLAVLLSLSLEAAGKT